MTKPIRHLHRDYHRSHCGLAATHILMTYDPAETTCAACAEGLAKFEAERLKAEEHGAENTEAE